MCESGTCAPEVSANNFIGKLPRPEGLQSNINVSSLIDTEDGLIDRAIYTDPQIYAQEQRRIFAIMVVLGAYQPVQEAL